MSNINNSRYGVFVLAGGLWYLQALLQMNFKQFCFILYKQTNAIMCIIQGIVGTAFQKVKLMSLCLVQYNQS